MHGVGKFLPGLSDFVGLTLAAVDDLDNIVYFRFSPIARGEREIGVESEWVVRDADGALVVRGHPRPNTSMTEPPLGSVVVFAGTQPPKAIVLRFESGHTIEIFDNSEQYESFCIPHAGVYI